MRNNSIIDEGRRVIRQEANACMSLEKRIGREFVKAIKTLLSCKGRVIVTGVGKSGIVGQKIAATLTSTGTPAFFLHPVEALHGDLGIVSEDDCVIVISKSGETDELYELLPAFKRMGLNIIALTGERNSTLADAADIILDVSVKEEACSYNLIPTSSTTIAMAMGDAIALALFSKRAYKLEDLAPIHPGGKIGKKLLWVADLMLSGKDVPIISTDVSMKEAVLEMTSKRGITSVVDKKGKLVGVITDGDLRRLVEKRENVFPIPVIEVMTRSPKTITKEKLAISAAKLMETYRITALIVIDNTKKPIGVIHLHDIMKAWVV